jgi:hypothetical protein
MLKTPIFRQAVQCVDGFQTSPKGTPVLDIRLLSRTARVWDWFEEKLSGYCVRRGTGNAVDGMFTFEAGFLDED